MGLLSTVGSATRYRVGGKLPKSIIENIGECLDKHKISEIDQSPMEKSVGWTSFETPYLPNFEGSSFSLGTYFVFSMRIDKKNISTKVVNKFYHIKMDQMLKESGRTFLTKNEKKSIKDHVKSLLYLKIPATPNIYDLIWDYEKSFVWFFSTLKSANEELEELFAKSFNLPLIRLFPFTIADLLINLTDQEKDLLSKTSPSTF